MPISSAEVTAISGRCLSNTQITAVSQPSPNRHHPSVHRSSPDLYTRGTEASETYRRRVSSISVNGAESPSILEVVKADVRNFPRRLLSHLTRDPRPNCASKSFKRTWPGKETIRRHVASGPAPQRIKVCRIGRLEAATGRSSRPQQQSDVFELQQSTVDEATTVPPLFLSNSTMHYGAASDTSERAEEARRAFAIRSQIRKRRLC
ncbi:hypothetical protein CC78DRAFT_583463 [Lojkania enalia]|uniref:Uncharacterized protein n=1 Tax=Lojkania enalia TaxID=147567 RepID=A0A9P4K3W6_9PLEO|nr:hypothetical protein CC78DRAFT_583463 [Didymosphaeria enalia]